MSNKIWGKVVGSVLGFALGGPIGAVFGFIVGYVHDGRVLDRDYSHVADMFGSSYTVNNSQDVFTLGVIVLGAKMAKADGRVTREEVEVFKRVFNVAPSQEANVGEIFNQARRSAQGFEPYAMQLAHTFRHNPIVLEEILGGLFMVAIADSPGLSAAEAQFLKKVSHIFNFSTADFCRIAACAGVQLPASERPHHDSEEGYAVLGIRASAANEDIKAAYRALILEHHPDRLVAQGLPPELVANATEKMKRINAAYDTLCKQRGIR